MSLQYTKVSLMADSLKVKLNFLAVYAAES